MPEEYYHGISLVFEYNYVAITVIKRYMNLPDVEDV